MRSIVRFANLALFFFALPLTLFGEEIIISQYGLSVDIPVVFGKEIESQTRVYKTWFDESDTISLMIFLIPLTNDDVGKSIGELKNWPNSGVSFINGFGSSNVRLIKKTQQMDCKYNGLTKEIDVVRMATQVEINVECKSPSGPVGTKYNLIEILTSKGKVIFRFDSPLDSAGKVDPLVSEIWRSIKIDSSFKLEDSLGSAKFKSKITEGGVGLRFRDYAQTNIFYILGEYFGALLITIIVGGIITFLLIKMRVPLMISLIVAQMILIVLRVYGAEDNGEWEIDPILYLVSSGTAIITNYFWFYRKQKFKTPDV